MTALNDNLSLQSVQNASSRVTVLSNIIQHQYDTQGLHDPRKMARVTTAVAAINKALVDGGLGVESIRRYGSTTNGYGSSESDLDITIKVSIRCTKQYPSAEAVLKKVAEILRKSDGNCHAQFVEGRVPIVKAFYRGFEMDMCYNDEAAVKDAELLRAYGLWDSRVFPLGVFIKKWAKAFGIGDGDHGFKSYHWLVLLINCLQKLGRKTKRGRNLERVLPYIQSEFWKGPVRNRPWRYFEATVIPNWSTNESSLAELFLYFLDFYLSFSFQIEVVHISSPARVTRRKKELAHPVCIRDPFFRGRLAYSRLSPADKVLYDEHYSYGGEPNSAKKVTQQNLQKILDAMRLTDNQIRGYLQGVPMTSPVLKKLFNL